MSGRAAATHGDAGTSELLADRARMNAQLGTDLAQGPALGVQVGCTLNIHGATVTSRSAACGSFGLQRSPGDACNEESGRRSSVIRMRALRLQGLQLVTIQPTPPAGPIHRPSSPR